MRCASLIAGAASLAVEAVAFTVSDANRGAAPAFVAPLVKAATAARELLAARGVDPCHQDAFGSNALHLAAGAGAMGAM